MNNLFEEKEELCLQANSLTTEGGWYILAIAIVILVVPGDSKG